MTKPLVAGLETVDSGDDKNGLRPIAIQRTCTTVVHFVENYEVMVGSDNCFSANVTSRPIPQQKSYFRAHRKARNTPLRSIPELADWIRYIAGSGLLLGANMSSSRSGVPSTRWSEG